MSKHLLFSSHFPETLHYNGVCFIATAVLKKKKNLLLKDRNLIWVIVLTKTERKVFLDYGASYRKLLRSLMILWMTDLCIQEKWERAKATQLVFLLHPICRQQYGDEHTVKRNKVWELIPQAPSTCLWKRNASRHLYVQYINSQWALSFLQRSDHCMEWNPISAMYYLPWCVWSDGVAEFPCSGVNTSQ